MSDSVTARAVARQAPLSMGFSRQEYRSGLPFPPPEDLPDPGIEPGSLILQAHSLPSELQGRSSWIHWIHDPDLPWIHGVVATEVGSLSLLQKISLTQELNQGLLHCRGILYQLSYQGSPMHVLFSGSI